MISRENSGKLSDISQVVATSGQISSEIAGESVILHLSSGIYYGLNEVGAHIWHLVQEPKTLAAVQSSLLEAYAVEPKACWQDLVTVITDLAEIGLVEVQYSATA